MLPGIIIRLAESNFRYSSKQSKDFRSNKWSVKNKIFEQELKNASILTLPYKAKLSRLKVPFIKNTASTKADGRTACLTLYYLKINSHRNMGAANQ